MDSPDGQRWDVDRAPRRVEPERRAQAAVEADAAHPHVGTGGGAGGGDGGGGAAAQAGGHVVVGAEHGVAAAGQGLEEFALGPGHLLPAPEELGVGHPDVGDHGDGGPGDSGQGGDVPDAPGAHLDHHGGGAVGGRRGG